MSCGTWPTRSRTPSCIARFNGFMRPGVPSIGWESTWSLLRDEDRILGVIDIDSDSSAAFAQDDERGLRAIADVLGEVLGPHLRLPG